LGECPQGNAWVRSGAQPGDALLVTGALGGSRAGRHLQFTPRLEEARCIRELCPVGVHACIDITDGLSRDLKHICEESACGAAIFQERVPISAEARASSANTDEAFQRALSDGEDFELLLAVELSSAKELLRSWNHATPLTLIGEVLSAERGSLIVLENGQTRSMPDIGYEHIL
jgi:thiamine-monophosphate kinase